MQGLVYYDLIFMDYIFYFDLWVWNRCTKVRSADRINSRTFSDQHSYA